MFPAQAVDNGQKPDVVWFIASAEIAFVLCHPDIVAWLCGLAVLSLYWPETAGQPHRGYKCLDRHGRKVI